MIHHYTNEKSPRSGDHWAVGSNTGPNPVVLVQLQENGDQVRLGMTPEQAENMARELLAHAQKVRQAKV